MLPCTTATAAAAAARLAHTYTHACRHTRAFRFFTCLPFTPTGAENEYNLFVVRKNSDAATDEERARLEVRGEPGGRACCTGAVSCWGPPKGKKQTLGAGLASLQADWLHCAVVPGQHVDSAHANSSQTLAHPPTQRTPRQTPHPTPRTHAQPQHPHPHTGRRWWVSITWASLSTASGTARSS